MRTGAAGAMAIALLAAAGCAPPAVQVSHTIPAGLPLPAEVTAVAAGTFEVRSNAPADLAEMMQRRLGAKLPSLRLDGAGAAPGRAAPGQVARVGGRIEADLRDVRGVRTVRRADASGQLADVSLPSLVRRIDMRVDFVVWHGRRRCGAVEVRRSYDSAADPRVRGVLGLDRGDEPDRVPAPAVIAGEMLDECIRVLLRTVEPLRVTATVSLRPAGGAEAREAMRLIERGRYGEAMEHFRAALAKSPGSAALHFDLAAAAEAAGKLDTALEEYRAAAAAAPGGNDAVAAECADRVRRVIAKLRPPVQ